MFYERYCELCKEIKKSPTGVGAELSFSKGTVHNWKKGNGINANTLVMLANYFHVTTDYLLGRTDKKQLDNENNKSEEIIIDSKEEDHKYIIEQLKFYKELLKTELITEEDYETKKKEILKL